MPATIARRRNRNDLYPGIPVGLIAKKRYNRMASPAYKEGLYEFQDEGSQLISLLADPKPGMTVIDACAGGGGKTLHLAEMMEGTGTIIALDVDMERMNGLEVEKNAFEYFQYRIDAHRCSERRNADRQSGCCSR